MKELKVIGAENGSLVLVSEDGDKFVVAIDATLQSALRPPASTSPRENKVSPRDVQARIRSGLSADEVAEATGAPIDYIRRFEGPVVAEREHIVASALGVRVHTAIDPDPLEEGTGFGDVIRERLESLGARGERWTSWKDAEEGWIVKVSFTSDQIDHDARWNFDPKKNILTPSNPEAITLSQQGEIRGTLIPRLRAVSPVIDGNTGRFDTGAFVHDSAATDDTAPQPKIDRAPSPSPTADPAGSITVRTVPAQSTGPIAGLGHTGSHGSIGHQGQSAPAGPATPFQRATTGNPVEQRQRDLAQTSDLLDALRRRRGEREAAVYTLRDEERRGVTSAPESETTEVVLDPFESEQDAPHGPNAIRRIGVKPTPSNGGVSDDRASAPESAQRTSPHSQNHPTPAHPAGGRANNRRGRASMPSWDEIVFGARTDDDHS